jgi:serine/threonine protein kinase
VSVCLAPEYRVLSLIRQSSLVDVYDCWSIERRCRCVIKTARDERSGRRLVREGRLLLKLRHPHVVRAYEVITRPVPAVVLETLTGATLGYVVHQSRLAPAEVAVLGLQLCSAVQYLHGNGVLHLDLKPSNIVAEGGLAKVLDLDIARKPGRGRGEGTRQYMAPEQAKRGALTTATDVWGIGLVMFEALTGRLAFEFDSGVEFPQIAGRAPRVRRVRRSVPAGLAGVVDGASSRMRGTAQAWTKWPNAWRR